MNDIWAVLEQRTQGWQALDRQSVADAIWHSYVTVRFARTGNPQALPFLYPYLNHAGKGIRLAAIDVAARVFEGRGERALRDLDYFTENTDPFLRDRAVHLIGSAMEGASEGSLLDALDSYLHHPNRFVQRQAMSAVARAARGSASSRILAEVRHVAETSKASDLELRQAIARLFSGAPTEETYSGMADRDAGWSWAGLDDAVGTLIRGASAEWYHRACREFFDPRLQAPEESPLASTFGGRRWPQFLHRSATTGLCLAGHARGMDALSRMLHLRDNRCCCNAILKLAPNCFAGADRGDNLEPLLALAQSHDLQEQRIGCTFLGTLMRGSDDEQTMAALLNAVGARSAPVRSAALDGLGLVATSTCDESLGKLCLANAAHNETAGAALAALGRIFLGSGRSDVFEEIRSMADEYEGRSKRSGPRYRPLVECYRAAGRVYQGTGSTEPADFLLSVLVPSPIQWCPYRSAAGQALMSVEFSERTLTRAFGDNWA